MSYLDYVQNFLATRPARTMGVDPPRRATATATAGPGAGLTGFAQLIFTLTENIRAGDALIIDQLSMLGAFISGTGLLVVSADAQIITNSNTGTGLAICPAGQNTSTTTRIVNEHSFVFSQPPFYLFEDLQAFALGLGAASSLLLPANQPLQILATLGILNSGAGASSIQNNGQLKWRMLHGQQEG